MRMFWPVVALSILVHGAWAMPGLAGVQASVRADADASVHANARPDTAPNPPVAAPNAPAASTAPIRVYLLAGQSNMEGHGEIPSLDHLANRPGGQALHARLRDRDGDAWAIRDDVFIAWPGRDRTSGPLTVGWGVRPTSIGPELGFGTVVGDAHAASVVLIKTAWGGADVWCDFRSPSAGPLNPSEQAVLDHQASDGRRREPGHLYRRMIEDVQRQLRSLGDVVPGAVSMPGATADEGQPWELAGFVWVQGWNDYCEWHVELDDRPMGRDLIAAYPANLRAMIHDVRRDLGVPDLPVVIAELGVNGAAEGTRPSYVALHAFRQAQRAVVEHPSLKNVRFVETAIHWDDELHALSSQIDRYEAERRERQAQRGSGSGSDLEADSAAEAERAALEARYRTMGGHWECHYHGSASTYALMGAALAEAMLELEREPD